MGENIFEVAKFFLSMEPMTHKKLQKLCYYAQAWYLAFYNVPLMNVRFEAWMHGPVSPLLYSRYKQWGGMTISKYFGELHLERNVVNYLHLIYDLYGKYSGDWLERLSHEEEPWKNARKGCNPGDYCTNEISQKDMQQYYSNMLAKR